MGSEDEGVTDRIAEASLEAASGVTGALLGAAVAGPGGAAVGAAIPPFVLAALDQFGVRWSRRRRENAARVLQCAAAQMDVDEAAVLATATDPRKELLAGTAINAGANTAMEGKIEALGRALARGLAATDDAKVDETALLVNALADVEVPHVRVLAVMGTDRRPELRARTDSPWGFLEYHYWAYDRGALAREFPQYGVALDGVLATLDRHGLIATVPVDLEAAFKAYGRRDVSVGSALLPHQIRDSKHRWRVTPLGLELLRLIDPKSTSSASDRA